MRKNRTRLLNVLALEDRLTPAVSVSFVGGSLTVTGDNVSNTIVLSGSGGKLQVHAVSGQNLYSAYAGDPVTTLANIRVPANNKGIYGLTGNITVNTGNSNDFVLFVIDDTAGSKTLPGNVNVSLGNGADNVLFATETNTTGTIAGTVNLRGGLGADNFFADDTAFQSFLQIDGGGSGFRTDGGVTNPNDVVELRNSQVANIMTVANAITFIGQVEGFPGTSSTLSSGLYVNNTTTNPLGDYNLDGQFKFLQYGGVLAIGPGSSVAGNVVYTGSNAKDNVTIAGTVGGTLTVSGVGGNDVVAIGQIDNFGADVPGTVNGSVNVFGGAGIDSFRLGDGSFVAGSVSDNPGDGDNLYDLDNAFAINGNFSIYAGNGNDDVGTVSGFVGGNQTYRLGNGANSLVWSGSAAGGRFDFITGGGGDSLTINGTNAFALFVQFGAGDDTFTYGPGTSVGSAYIDFGAGNDVYNDGGNTITWPQTIIGL